MKIIDTIREADQPVPERNPAYYGDGVAGPYAYWQGDRAEISVHEDVDRWEILIAVDHPTARADIWRDIVNLINARFGEDTP